MKMLKLADNLSLPWSIVHEKIDVLGVSGSGKTTTMLKLFELLYETGSQVLFVDSVGNAYSVKSAANGTDPGIPVPVFGGDHGDMPLPPDGGAKIARALVELETSAVLDISELDDIERVRFVRDFANAMLRLRKAKRNARAMHMLYDEAYDVAPEKTSVTGEGAMTAAVVRMLKKIRNYGSGWSLSTQDAQSTTKRALNQARTVIAHQLIADHDREYLRKWVGAKVRDLGAFALLDRMSDLKTGEALVFSPALKFFGVVKVAPRWTFDLKPPEVGEVREEPKKLAAADMKHLRELLADVAEPAEEEPEAAAKPAKGELARLRARVRELEAERKHHAPPVPRLVEVPVLTADERVSLIQAGEQASAAAHAFESVAKSIAASVAHAGHLGKLGVPVTIAGDKVAALPAEVVRAVKHDRTPRRAFQTSESPPKKESSSGDVGARMLACLHVSQTMTRRALGIFSGCASGSGYFRKQLGLLKEAGMVAESESGITLTAKGSDFVREKELTPDRGLAVRKLTGTAAKMAEALACAGSAVSRRQLGIVVGIASSSGYFRKELGRLRSAELIDESEGAVMLCAEALRAAGLVFEVKAIDFERVLAERRAGFQGLALKLFDAVVASRGGMTRAALGKAVGSDPDGGYFRKELGKLRAKELIDEPGELVKPAAELFAQIRSAA